MNRYEVLAVIVFVLIAHMAGALSHERDIQNQCRKTGDSGYSTWLGKLQCSPIEDQTNKGK